MPPLITAAGTLQCAHGGMIPLIPAGTRPLIGGSPGIVATDLMGKVAAGCTFNISGAPAPCVVVSVISGICTKVTYAGTPALHQGLSCATSNGTPTMPVSSAGQTMVQGT
ncbi:MAG: hypothetical protein J7513_13940 [Solirubrobacteraceae bacterium]|nr:hypothetical protein [Solirubrobacteraceae bacterium]